jgi:hypothetical protein
MVAALRFLLATFKINFLTHTQNFLTTKIYRVLHTPSYYNDLYHHSYNGGAPLPPYKADEAIGANKINKAIGAN